MPIWLCNPDILSSLLLWFSVWSSKEAMKVIEDYFTENILQYLSLLIHCVKWILNLADPKSWQNHNYSAVKINIVIHNVPFIYSTLIKGEIEWRMAYRENTVPRLLLLRQGQTQKDTPPVVSCEQDSQNTKCVQVSIITHSRCNQTSYFSFSALFDQLIKCCHISISPSTRNGHNNLSQRTRTVQNLPVLPWLPFWTVNHSRACAGY